MIEILINVEYHYQHKENSESPALSPDFLLTVGKLTSLNDRFRTMLCITYRSAYNK